MNYPESEGLSFVESSEVLDTLMVDLFLLEIKRRRLESCESHRRERQGLTYVPEPRARSSLANFCHGRNLVTRCKVVRL